MTTDLDFTTLSLFSAGEVCEVTGLHLNNIDRWSTAWLQGKAAGHRGSGTHRRYTLIECLALYAGARWRAEGADPGRVAGVVYFVSRLHREQLEAAFEEGRTFPVPEVMLGNVSLPGGGMLLEPVNDPDNPSLRVLMDALDLKRCWEHVLERVAELRSRQPKPLRGRAVNSAPVS